MWKFLKRYLIYLCTDPRVGKLITPQSCRSQLDKPMIAKRTRKHKFFDEMRRVIRWSELLLMITTHAPTGKTGWSSGSCRSSTPSWSIMVRCAESALYSMPRSLQRSVWAKMSMLIPLPHRDDPTLKVNQQRLAGCWNTPLEESLPSASP